MSNHLSSRLVMIDALRGLVILFMLLDHVRETFYLHHQVPDPMDVATTEPSLFWSRTLAHLCAPIFVLLTGLSAYLFQQKKQDLQQTRAFLLKRGAFLIFLELTLVGFAWTAQFPPEIVYLQVIWAIGVSMIALALMVGWSWQKQLLLAVAIIALHNLFDQVSFSQPWLQNIWAILHQRGWIEISEHFKLRTSYPVLPWIGIILLGYVFGQLFQPRFDRIQRNRYLLMIGCGCITAFVLLRLVNVYGDQPWLIYSDWQMTLMSFFNLTKYPPSLLFCLWNIGMGVLIMVLFDRYSTAKVMQPLTIIGSVPMFFYVLHLYVLKILYLIAVAFWGLNYGAYFGVSNVAMLWGISLILILALYPIVRAFSQFKHQNPQITLLKYF